MTTAYPSPGIIPAEICIARLGEDYGSKGAPVPTCAEHDAAALAIYDAVLPLYTTAVAVAATYPGLYVTRGSDGSYGFHGGAIGGGGGGFAEVPAPGREPLPEIPAPVPLPTAGLLLICAVVALRIVRMTR